MNKSRTENINIQRLKGAETNKLKGILTFVKKTTKKKDIVHNQIIDELIESGYYEDIYNKYVLDDIVDIEDIPVKDFDILEMLEYCFPDDLKSKYKGFNIQSFNL